MENNIPKSIGFSPPRADVFDKVQGKAKYADDICLPGMLWGRVLRSPYAHAQIIDIKIGKALALPGVEAVLTAKDIPGKNLIGESRRKAADCPVLCEDKVRHIGDSVALVVAQSEDTAERALDLIEVTYEPLPAVFSPDEALMEGAPLVHGSGNILKVHKLIKGDVNEALEKADIVISNTYCNKPIQHAYLEIDTVISFIDENGKVNLISADWWPHYTREVIASILNLKIADVHIIGVTNGGSFGGKLRGNPICFQACLLAWKTKKPVKMKLTRQDIFKVGGKHTPFVAEYVTAADNQGNLLAVKARITFDSGAYADASPGVLMNTVTHSCGPYRVPNVYVIGTLVYTNNPATTAIRGFGNPQIAVAYESQMDILAKKLGMDPWELRIKNALRPEDYTATGQRLSSSVGLLETIRKTKFFVHDRFGDKKEGEGDKKRGRGIACIWKGCGRTGVYNPSEAAIEAEPGGTFTIYTSIGDLGQGAHTVLKQIAAETLGVSYQKIKLVGGDTDLCPDSGSESATRVTYFVGNAVRISSLKLRELIVREAAGISNLGRSRQFAIHDNAVISQDGSYRIPFSELIDSLRKRGISPKCHGFFEPEYSPISEETGEGIPYPTYGFGTLWAEVEVNTRTGQIDVINLVADYDLGKAIHPLNVTGQIEGGVVMGMGNALSEELIIKNGHVENCDFSTYLVPTFMDAPQIYPFYTEAEDPSGPYGAKGLAEHTTVGTAAAILNAVNDAIGIRFYEIPVTPEKVLMSLKKKTLETNHL